MPLRRTSNNPLLSRAEVIRVIDDGHNIMPHLSDPIMEIIIGPNHNYTDTTDKEIRVRLEKARDIINNLLTC